MTGNWAIGWANLTSNWVIMCAFLKVVGGQFRKVSGWENLACNCVIGWTFLKVIGRTISKGNWMGTFDRQFRKVIGWTF